jgi:hypothetical protein|eukprot:evm.model.NODE_10718_length_12398_cov_39.478546.2
MYQAMTQELGHVDCLGEDYGPTSITLNRRYRIDYIWAKVGGKEKGREGGGKDGRGDAEGRGEKMVLEKVEVTPALDVQLAGVQSGGKYLVPHDEEATKAAYGLPLPAIEDQPCIPSDHLHVSAHLTFRVDRQGVGGKAQEKEGEERLTKDL